MSEHELFSERNILNSIALFFAEKLLEAGYLVYWHTIDAVQTPDGMYTNYTATSATYLLDPVFSGRISTAKGLVAVTEGETAFPRFPTGPTTTGAVSTADRVQVPCFGIDIGPDVALQPYEHGTDLRWRVRSLFIEGRARNRTELTWFADKLAMWFDEDVLVGVEDHDGLSGLPPSHARVTRRLVTREVIEDLGEQDRFQVELSARLEFIA